MSSKIHSGLPDFIFDFLCVPPTKAERGQAGRCSSFGKAHDWPLVIDEERLLSAVRERFPGDGTVRAPRPPDLRCGVNRGVSGNFGHAVSIELELLAISNTAHGATASQSNATRHWRRVS